MYALDLDRSHYDNLLKILQKSYSVSDLHRKKGALKQAIIDHFHTTGQEILLSVFADHIVVKKTFSDMSQDEAYDRSLHGCTVKLMEIASDPATYRSAGTLWIIDQDIRMELYDYYAKSNISEEKIKEGLRQRIELLFELDESEIVLFLRGNIYIRKTVPTPKSAAKEDRRFVGKSPQEMERIYKQYFPDGAWPQLESILPDILSDRLDFSTISNRQFIKTFILVFRSMVEIVILEKASELDKEDLTAFSGFILRLFFDPILKHTAQDLLKHIELRDKSAETFVKYYNGNVVIDDEGKKITQHAIIDGNGQQWNYSSMLSVLIQWKEAKNRAKSQDERLRETMERQKEAEQSLAKVEPLKKQADGVINVLKAQVQENRDAFKKLKEQGSSQRNALLNLKNEDRRLIELLRKGYEEHDGGLRSYDNALKEVKNWHRQAASNAQQLKDIYAQNKLIKVNYNNILKALMGVLAKR